MLSSRQKSHLKSLASTLYSTFVLRGTEIDEYDYSRVEYFLRKKELIKIAFVSGSEKDIKDVANTIIENTNAELIEIRANKVVLYRASRSNIIKFNNI